MKEIKESMMHMFESYEEAKKPREDVTLYQLLRKTNSRINGIVKRVKKNEDDIEELSSKSKIYRGS